MWITTNTLTRIVGYLFLLSVSSEVKTFQLIQTKILFIMVEKYARICHRKKKNMYYLHWKHKAPFSLFCLKQIHVKAWNTEITTPPAALLSICQSSYDSVTVIKQKSLQSDQLKTNSEIHKQGTLVDFFCIIICVLNLWDRSSCPRVNAQAVLKAFDGTSEG